MGRREHGDADPPSGLQMSFEPQREGCLHVKKTIMTLGYAFAVFLLGIGIAALVLAFAGKRLDRSSKAYADAAITAIVTEWDVAELQKRASPEYNDAVDYDEIEDDFDVLRDMGVLMAYRGSTGDSLITLSLRYGYEITADYRATVEFEAGSTDIRILLIRHSGQWQILDLLLDPQVYSENKDVI